MIKLVKTISTSFDTFKKRIVKVMVMGKNDVQTCQQITPFGVDSNPTPNLVAVYAKTGEMGKTVIIGYLNKDLLAGIGETRLFSTDEVGVLKSYIWLKNDETIEIGGDGDFMVRYSALATAFNLLKTDLDTVRAALSLPPSLADISGAKIDKIKTMS